MHNKSLFAIHLTPMAEYVCNVIYTRNKKKHTKTQKRYKNARLCDFAAFRLLLCFPKMFC